MLAAALSIHTMLRPQWATRHRQAFKCLPRVGVFRAGVVYAMLCFGVCACVYVRMRVLQRGGNGVLVGAGARS